jgi:hypothetical protein
MKNGTLAEVLDGTLLNDAAESLLAQMGVVLTETGRRSLTTSRYMTARAEADYARGVAAEASGAAVEALLNYSQAAAFDPSRLEALSRLGSVSSEISGGSVSANILNDLKAYETWLDVFKEAAAFFNSRPPFEIVYDPNLLQIGTTDYVNKRADLAMRISVMPSETGFGALNALLEGLEKTGKRDVWGFAGWPLLDITPKKIPEAVLFPGKRSFSFTVQAGLVNEYGKVIAKGETTLKTGTIVFEAGDASVEAPEGSFGQIDFPKVNAGDLTPTLTVVIAGVNNLSGRRISETGYMRIAPGDVARQEREQQAREERERQEREWQPLGAENFDFTLEGDSITITKYKGSATEVVIPFRIDDIPVTSIGDNAFYDCDHLVSVSIPSSVTSIGGSAFDNCDSLVSVTIPSSVTSIGYLAFSGCNKLTDITVDAGNTVYSSVNGVLFSKDGKTLIQYPQGKTFTSYTIPSGVTSIGNDAFWDCRNLVSVTIPSSVTSIGDCAFWDCRNLVSVTIPSSVTSIGGWAFKGCDKLSATDREAIRRRFGDGVF